MPQHPIPHNRLPALLAVPRAKHLEPLAHAIRRITQHGIEEAAAAGNNRGVCQVADKAVNVPVRQAILDKVILEPWATGFSANLAAVNVAAPCCGAKGGGGDKEGAGAGEGVVDELGGAAEGEVGGDEGEGGVHACCADVGAFFEVVGVGEVSGAGGEAEAEVEGVWRGGVGGVGFEEGEGCVWVVHGDGAVQGQVGEGVDEGELGGGGVRGVVGLDGEFEGVWGEAGPEVGGAVLDGAVEGGEGGGGGPELVDGFGEDAAGDEGAGGGAGGEEDGGVGALWGGGVMLVNCAV